jgi:hypothetical protein
MDLFRDLGAKSSLSRSGYHIAWNSVLIWSGIFANRLIVVAHFSIFIVTNLSDLLVSDVDRRGQNRGFRARDLRAAQ